MFEKVTNGKQHYEHIMAISSMLWCFDLRNAHVILQHLMNYEFLDEYLDDFVVCYINHIFTFFKNMEDNEW
jgi:hypothetical protein